MDLSMENLQLSQGIIAGYFKQEKDEKLQNMNNQDETSCWSESASRCSEFPQLQQIMADKYSSNKKISSFQLQEISNNMNDQSRLKVLPSDIFVEEVFENNCFPNYKKDQEQNDLSFRKSEKVVNESESSDFYTKSIGAHGRQTIDEKNNITHNTANEKSFKSKFFISGDLLRSGNGKVNIPQLTKIKFKLRNFYNKFTIRGRTSRINKEIRTLINDQSDIILPSSQNYLTKLLDFSVLSVFVLKKLEQIPLINLQSTSGFVVHLIFSLFNCFFLFVFSLIIIFQGYQQYLSVFYIIVRLIWTLEILFKINTIQYQTLGVQSQRKKIIINYINTQAFFDVFPIISISFTSTNQLYSIFTQVLVYLKIFNIFSDLSLIQKKICMMIKKYYFIQLINLFITVFLIAHIIACLWYLVGIIELKILELDATWFSDVRELNDIWWQYYIWSLYWSLTLMTTGSNTANSLLQASFTLFVMLFTTISFAYLVNVIGIILSAMDESQQQKRRDMNIINEYMRQKKISKNLQAKVNLDLEYYYQNNFKRMQEDNNSVLEKISEDHQKLLLREYNSKIITKIPFLNSNFSQEVLDELSLYIKEEYYFPNQIIQKESLHQDISIYYIISGQGKHTFKFLQPCSLFFNWKNIVELVQTEQTDVKLCKNKKILKENQIFGEINFFTGLSNEVGMRSTDFTKVIRISRNSFINIIKEREKDFETFCQIKDKILFYSDHSDLKLICPICNVSSHLINNCSIVHFNREKELEKQRILQSRSQESQIFQRRKRRQYNSIKQLKEIQHYAKPVRELLKQQTQSYYRQNFIHNYDDTYTSQDEDEDYSEESQNVYIALDNLFFDYQKKQQQQQHSDEQTNSRTLLNKELQLMHQNTSDNAARSQKIGITGESNLSVRDLDENFQVDNLSAVIKGQQSEQQISSIKTPLEKIDSLKNLRRQTFENNKSTKNIPDNRTSIVLEVGNIKDIYEIIEQNQNLQKNLKIKVPRKSIMRINQKQEKTLKDLEQKKDQLKSARTLPSDLKRQTSTAQYIKSQTIVTSMNSQAVLIKGLTSKGEEQEKQQFNPWEFESLKDFKYYFHNGNSKFQIAKQIRYAKRKNRTKNKKVSSKQNK